MATPADSREGKHSIEVHILGQKMVLKSDEDPRHIERIASYVKRKVDEVASRGPIAAQKLAVLAALNIAEDYFKALDDSREFKRQVAAKSKAILAELES